MKHGQGQGEFALCGLAFDAFDSKDVDEPVEFAEAGEPVTCPDCRRMLDFIRGNYRRYTYTPS